MGFQHDDKDVHLARSSKGGKVRNKKKGWGALTDEERTLVARIGGRKRWGLSTDADEKLLQEIYNKRKL